MTIPLRTEHHRAAPNANRYHPGEDSHNRELGLAYAAIKLRLGGVIVVEKSDYSTKYTSADDYAELDMGGCTTTAKMV